MKSNSSLATPFFDALIGEKISHVWRGGGSAIFIELGNLRKRRKLNGEPGEPKGDITVMIEWSWRIEGPKSILGGSWSSERGWPKIFEKIIGESVLDVQLFGVLPEICILLSNGSRVTSFMTANGQPQWTILTHDVSRGALGVKRGRLHVEI
ncbi:hypothetical protein [Herbaspirillum sp. meg3]|uniref:hypothetical protein n=1 Tax=Herbaspirillum sp. meg3 TaxID=2025949 RepID=UPI0012FD151B|nr:hypothetical protein [Herbaspirillum sp. meg3]